MPLYFQTSIILDMALQAILAELRAARTEDARWRAARRLRTWVRQEGRSGRDTAFAASSLTLLFNRLYELINSPDLNDKLAGCTAIYELIDEPFVGDNETKTLRFANYLRSIAPSTNDPVVLKLAARTLGHLARSGGTMTVDFVDFEVKRALEWLQAQPEPRSGETKRLAAVYTLRELCEAAPTLFYVHTAVFFTCIWSALTDPGVNVREAGAKALSSALALIARRRSRNREQWYAGLYRSTKQILTSMPAPGPGGGGSSSSSAKGPVLPVELIHGAMLTIAELLQHGGLFMASRFNDTCEMVLRYREHKEKLVRRTVIVLLPRLAHYHPEAFLRSFAEVTLIHLLNSLRDPKQAAERGTAYVAVGRVALAIGPHLASSEVLRPQLERIVAVVREGLTPSSGATGGSLVPVVVGSSAAARRARPFVPEALTCIAMLAKAVGPPLMEYMYALIDPLFSGGLGPMLTEALQAVATAIPGLRPLLQERLLHEVALILAGRPFVPPFADTFPSVFSTSDGYGLFGDDHGHHGHHSGLPSSSPLLSLSHLLLASASAGGLGETLAGSPAGYGTLGSSYSLAKAYGSLGSSKPASALTSVASLLSGHSASAAWPGSGLGAGAHPGAPSASHYSNSGVGSGPGGGASGMLGVPSGHTQALSLSSSSAFAPASMSWARHMPSALTAYGGGEGGAGATSSSMSSGGGGSGAGGLGSAAMRDAAYAAASDPLSPIVPASSRGVATDVITLALHTLGTFDFSGVPLLPFAREVILLYLDDPSPAVRLEAGLTCCRLLVRPTDTEGAGVDPLLDAAGDVFGLDDVSGGATGADHHHLHGDDGFGSGVGHKDHHHDPSMSGVEAGDDAEGEEEGDSDDSDASWASEEGEAGNASSNRAHVLEHGNPGAEAGAAVLEGQRELRRRKRRYLRRLRPPAHPLLVFGTDYLSTGDGLSPAALAVAGYTGGYASAGDGQTAPHGSFMAQGRLHVPRRRKDGTLIVDGITAVLGSLATVIGNGPTRLLIGQVLQRLVMVAITDTDPAVRFEMLCSLDGRFDPLLVEEDNLRLLLQGLNDENYACREAALGVIGRLTPRNPGAILPALRQTLLTLLAELEHPDAHPDVAPLVTSAALFTGRAGGIPPSSSTATLGGRGGGGGAAGSTITGASAGDPADADVLPGSGLSSVASAGARLMAYHTHAQGHQHQGDGTSTGPFSASLSSALMASSVSSGREHAARMLGLLIRCSQRLVAPYVALLLRALVPHAWAASPARLLTIADSAQPSLSPYARLIASTSHREVLSSSLLAALGELSAVGPDMLMPYLPVLMPLVVEGITVAAQAVGVSVGGAFQHAAVGGGGSGKGALSDGRGASGGAAGGLSGLYTRGADASAALSDLEGPQPIAAGGSGGGRSVAATGAAGGSSASALGGGRTAAAVPQWLTVIIASGHYAHFLEVAVRVLGTIVENTGHVIVPYLDHPQLLQLLLAILARAPASSLLPGGSSSAKRSKASGSSSSSSSLDIASPEWPLRREILRTIGILGALDPYRYRMAQIAQAQRAAAAVQAAVQARLAAAVASAAAQGRRLGAAGLSHDVLMRGMRPGAGAPFQLLDIDLAHGSAATALSGGPSSSSDSAIALASSGSGAWDLHSAVPHLTGVALGGGIDVDPMEAAMAGLAGEWPVIVYCCPVLFCIGLPGRSLLLSQ